MTTIWTDLLHLFYPNLCRLCGAPLIAGETQICLRCLADLPHTHYHRQANNPVEQRFTGKIPYQYASAFLHYEKGGAVQHLIHSLKYHENREIGYWLGRLAAQELLKDNSPLCHTDLLVPVPLHPRKEKKRGYNQAAEIARGLHAIWHTPIGEKALSRTRFTDTQTRRSVYDRWENVQEIFTAADSRLLENKHILIVDDVITTGSTLAAAAAAALAIPGTTVSLFSIAVA